MIKFIDLFKSEITAGLENVTFIRNKTDDKKNYTVGLSQRMDSKAEGDDFTIYVTREVLMGEDAPFSLKATYYVQYTVKDEYKNEFAWEDYDLDKELQNNIEKLAIDCMDTLSLIIGQITGSFGNNPLITPPKLVFPKANKSKQ